MHFLGGIERGEYNPSVDLIGRIAAVLDVHPSAFFDDDAVQTAQSPGSVSD